MTHVTLKGQPVHIEGSFLKMGNLAPDFVLVGNDLATLTLKEFKGKKKLLMIVPSIETSVCSKQTITLSKLALAHPDVAILVISKDLPFAHARFCKNERVNNITLLTDMRVTSNFGKDYGVLISSGPLEGLLTRSVLVLNEHDKVIYSAMSLEITSDLDLEAAFSSL